MGRLAAFKISSLAAICAVLLEQFFDPKDQLIGIERLLHIVVRTLIVGKLDVPRVEFGGGGANPFNWPGRALDSADARARTRS